MLKENILNFKVLLDNMGDNSPLIKWLIDKFPLLIKSFTLAVVISYITGKMLTNRNSIFQLSVPIFVILTVCGAYAPKIFKIVEYSTGFAISAILFSQ